MSAESLRQLIREVPDFPKPGILFYDITTLINSADAFGEGKRTREGLIDYLGSLEGYQGASGNLTFGTGRTNLELPLYTLRDGQVQPLVQRPAVEESPEDNALPDSVEVEIIKYEP